jgi:hypothetical protein
MALKPFNSVAGFSVGEVPANVILGNGDITTGNVTLTGDIAAGNVKTNNLLYANGAPWDLQEASGSNGYVQFNSNGNFAASANFTFDNSNNVLTVIGNVLANAANITGNLTVGGTIIGNISGNISGNVTPAGSNTQIQYNNSNTLGASANFTFDQTTSVLGLTGNLNLNGAIVSSSNGNITIEPDGTGILVVANTAGGATGIALGDPTAGNLISNAITLTNSSSVSNAIAQLNDILGKLVPPAPTNFPGATTLSVNSLSSYRMANFTQTDNTPSANKNVAGGTTVTTVRRSSSYATNTVANVGPGNQGTVTVYLNGSDAGNRTLTNSLNGNGTYSNLVITNNFDYRNVNANIAAGFWSVFTSYAAGTVTEGWNEVKIGQSATSNTNQPYWYYDASSPGQPVVSNVSITAPGSPSYTYSSTVAHYNNSNQFTLAFEVNRLSGDMYPTSDSFITGTAGGAFSAPVTLTYATAGVTTPLARNLYVSSGTLSTTTTSNIISGFGASTGSPSISVLNSYLTGTGSFSPSANVLYKTGTASTMEEANVVIGGTIGSGSGLAFRIINPGSTDTPAYTASAAAFNSQSSTLQTYDATIVAAILKHDQTNYSTGYLPVGPDLSAGRSGSQYFTFKFVRTSVSKFDVRWTGTLAGLWVALPGSTIDSTSTLNGWLDMSVAYGGAGVPGANTGAGGNGSNGCALGTVAPLNSAQVARSITATFGTVSSSSTATNEIYVRIKLTSGQSITALSLQPASN